MYQFIKKALQIIFIKKKKNYIRFCSASRGKHYKLFSENYIARIVFPRSFPHSFIPLLLSFLRSAATAELFTLRHSPSFIPSFHRHWSSRDCHLHSVSFTLFAAVSPFYLSHSVRCRASLFTEVRVFLSLSLSCSLLTIPLVSIKILSIKVLHSILVQDCILSVSS